MSETRKTKTTNSLGNTKILRVDEKKLALSKKANEAAYLQALTKLKTAQANSLKKNQQVTHPLPSTQVRLNKQLTKRRRENGRGSNSPNEGWPSLDEMRKMGNARQRNNKPRNQNSKRKPQKKRVRKEKEEKKDQKSDWLDSMIEVGGRLATHFLPLLLGAGDYEEAPGIVAQSPPPKENSFLAFATDGEQGGDVPMMHSDGNVVRVAKREYLGDIYSTTSPFASQEFPVNPGMAETFIWEAPIGGQFTNYSIEGMIVEIVSEGSEYTASAGLGYYALASQYNVNETPFLDKREMLNSNMADACKPSRNLIHAVECDKSLLITPALSIRTGDPPPNSDLRLYDHSRLTVAVGGNVADNVIIGELWISYDIKLMIPRIRDGAAQTNFAMFNAGATATNSAPLGTAWTFSSRNTFTPTVSSTAIGFPNGIRGDFLGVFSWAASPAVATTSVVPVITYTNIGPKNSEIVVQTPGTTVTGGVQFSRTTSFRIVKDGGILTFSGVGNIANPSAGFQAIIVQMPREDSFKDSPIFDRNGERNLSQSTNLFDEKGNIVDADDDNVGDVVMTISPGVKWEIIKSKQYIVKYIDFVPSQWCQLTSKQVKACYIKSKDPCFAEWVEENIPLVSIPENQDSSQEDDSEEEVIPKKRNEKETKVRNNSSFK